MNKKTRTVLLIVLLLVVATVATRPLWQGEGASGKTAVSVSESRGGDNSGNQGASPQPADKKN